MSCQRIEFSSGADIFFGIPNSSLKNSFELLPANLKKVYLHPITIGFGSKIKTNETRS